jgi:hypothetical protein
MPKSYFVRNQKDCINLVMHLPFITEDLKFIRRAERKDCVSSLLKLLLYGIDEIKSVRGDAPGNSWILSNLYAKTLPQSTINNKFSTLLFKLPMKRK